MRTRCCRTRGSAGRMGCGNRDGRGPTRAGSGPRRSRGPAWALAVCASRATGTKATVDRPSQQGNSLWPDPSLPEDVPGVHAEGLREPLQHRERRVLALSILDLGNIGLRELGLLRQLVLSEPLRLT